MANTASRKTKLKERRGTGSGADYQPWIKAREIPSIGTCSNPIDWKHGRTMELLSEGETAAYYILRWNDDVLDIREQFPLDLETTNKIAEKLELKPVTNGSDNMTTDLVVTRRKFGTIAYSVKNSPGAIMNKERELEKLAIEKAYWERKGVPFVLLFKSMLDTEYAGNIRLCVEFYNPDTVYDQVSLFKHLLARKKIRIDMRKRAIEFGNLAEKEPYHSIVEQEWRKHYE